MHFILFFTMNYLDMKNIKVYFYDIIVLSYLNYLKEGQQKRI